jgi:hypothetical protein
MSKAYKIKVNQGAGEAKFVDIPQAGVSGKPLSVKAVPGGKYQLLDGSTGYAPENIRASRSGKDLQVFFEGRAQPDLVIEDYYEVTPEGFNGLIGESESGRFYEYIPESAVGNTAVPLLADGSTQVGMALGGAEISASGAAVGALVAAAAFNPLLLAPLALLGAGGGGGGGGPTDTTPPVIKSANLHVDDDSGPKDNVTNDKTPRIVVETEANADVSVELNGKTYAGKADANGLAVIQVPDADALKDGHYVPKATATDAAKNKSPVFDGTPFRVDTSSDRNEPDTDLNTGAEIKIESITEDSGPYKNDFYTNDTQLVFHGTLKSFTENGAWVKLELKDASGKLIDTDYVKPVPNGSSWDWSWDRTQKAEMIDGQYLLSVVLVDGADNVVGVGNSRVADEQTITIDTDIDNNFVPGKEEDPNKSSTIDIVSMDFDTGHNLNEANESLSNGDFITQDRTHVYSGKVSFFKDNGASIELTLTQGNTVIEKTYVKPDDKGNWTWDRRSKAELTDGMYSLQAQLLDKAGNLISSDSQAVTVDNSQDSNAGGKDPNAGLKLGVISIANDTLNDYLINDPTPTFSGTFDKTFTNNGDRVLVKIFDDQGKLINQKYVLPKDNVWELPNLVELGKAGETHNYTIKASLVDAAGNTLSATDQTFVVDRLAPNLDLPKPVASGDTTLTYDKFNFSAREQGSYTYTTGDKQNPTKTVDYTGGFFEMSEIAGKTFSPGEFLITFTDKAGNVSSDGNTNGKTWIFESSLTSNPPAQLPEPGFGKNQLVGSVGTQDIKSPKFDMASLYDGIAAIPDVAAANHIKLVNGMQTLDLTMGDVLELGVKNSFINSGVHLGRLQLKIDGDGNDVVNLDNLVGSTELTWNTNNEMVTIGDQNYKVYSNGDLGLSLFVNDLISNSNINLV